MGNRWNEWARLTAMTGLLLIGGVMTARAAPTDHVAPLAPARSELPKSLRDVVTHYEVALSFKFSEQERQDLVAFMEAL